MALREEVILSIQRAQQQISQLESELSRASQPINVPVTVQGEEAITRLQTQLDAADETVDVQVRTFGLESADRTFDELSGSIDETREQLQQAQVQADRLGDELNTTGSRGVSAFGSLRSAIGPLIATFAAGLGLRAVVDQFNAAIDSATALSESINAVNVVFGEGGQVIEEFGRTSAESVGLAASQVNELVTPIGALLQNFGLEGRDAADAALELTQRAADLASVFNTDVNVALEAIGSALRGEQEPIRRFGVNLNAAAADAKALELGLVGAGEEVSIAARGQANYALLLEQTSFAAGDFANTADEAANRQRILTAEFESARAELGQALLPLFEDLLDIGPDVIASFENLIPVVGLLAGQFQSTADDLLPLLDLLGGIASVAGAAGDALGGIELGGGLSEIFQLGQGALNPAAPISVLVDEFQNLKSLVDGGIGTAELAAELEQLEARADAGAEPIAILGQAFGDLREEGVDTVGLLGELAEATGIADDDLAEFVVGLIQAADRMGLTETEVRQLRDQLAALFETDVRGDALNFERQGRGARELADDLGLIAEAAPLSAEGIEFLDEAFEGVDFQALVDDFPVVIRDLEDLRLAAEEAGVSTTDFLNNLPDNVVLDLSQPELAILGLIEELDTLDQRLADFQPENVIDLSDFINEDTGQIDASLADIRQAVNEQLGAEAEFQLDLSQIALVAPDIAAILEAEGIDVAGDIAAKFAADLENAADQQAFIDGNKGLAAATAEQYAEFLRDLTPEELQRVAAFGPQNLIPALRDQLVSTGQEMAEILDTTLGETTIAPELTIDLANIIFQNLPELTFDVSATGTSSTGTGTGTGSGGNSPPPPPVEVIINNPTTEDLNTSATQAAQTIGAVSTLLPRAQ